MPAPACASSRVPSENPRWDWLLCAAGGIDGGQNAVAAHSRHGHGLRRGLSRIEQGTSNSAKRPGPARR